MNIFNITPSLIGSIEGCPTSSCNPLDVLIPMPSEVSFSECTASLDGPVETAVDPRWEEFGDEGYSLTCHQEGFRLVARTEKGAFYGQQTLDQIKALGLIPCCTITDKPAMKMRGVMFDLARLKEKHEYYYHMIDQLAKWKINTVFLHFTDHSGCAIEVRSYPNLATAYAFTQEEMKDMIRYAADRHIELIPEIETWGHAKYITRLPELADLAEDPDDPRALCTSNPRTFEVLHEILAEMAELFPSQYIHVGCDEAAFGRCEKCVAVAEQSSKDVLVGTHIQKVCEITKRVAKTPMLWGDVLLQYRESVELVPKDAVITHWDYRADLPGEPVEFLKSQGYEVVGCPAVVWGSRMILPMADTFDNVANFARIALDNDCMGMETTIWVPQRYITDTLPFSLAYATEMSWTGPKRSRIDFARAFIRNYWGGDPGVEVAQALLDAHTLSDKSFDKLTDLWKFVQKLSEESDEELCETESLSAPQQVHDVLTTYRKHVVDHIAEYDGLLLGVETGVYLRLRTQALKRLVFALRTAQRSAGGPGGQCATEQVDAAARLLDSIREREDSVRSSMEDAWNRWRYADDPAKHAGGENLMGAFYASERFIKTMIIRVESVRDKVAHSEEVNWGRLFTESDEAALETEIW